MMEVNLHLSHPGSQKVQTEMMEVIPSTSSLSSWVLKRSQVGIPLPIVDILPTIIVMLPIILRWTSRYKRGEKNLHQVEILECYRQQVGKSPAEAEGEYLTVARWT